MKLAVHVSLTHARKKKKKKKEKKRNFRSIFNNWISFLDSKKSPPPPYTKTVAETTADSPYAFLGDFDTVFLIDDSSSMWGKPWQDVAAVLETITPICTAWDADGVDLYFLNKQDNTRYMNITTAAAVQQIFREVSPLGSTPTGKRLNAIMNPYLHELVACTNRGAELPKPMNIIVITDGAPTDDPESVIAQAAKRLDRIDAPSWQIGIQFFQVGRDQAAARALKDLDDNLTDRYHIRDMVDTVAWNDGERLDGDFILKVSYLLGLFSDLLNYPAKAWLVCPGFGE